MKPLFLITPPRHRGDLLVRILNGTPGIRAAGDCHDFLARLRRLHAYREAILRDHPDDHVDEETFRIQRHRLHATERGWDDAVRRMLPAVCEPPEGTACYAMRDIFSLTGEWDKDSAFLSWLQFLEPDASILFLKRDQGEVEISLMATHHLWIPKYGSCHGKVVTRLLNVWGVMDRYHRLNPESTVILDSGALLEWERAEEGLRRCGVVLERTGWQRAVDHVAGDGRTERILSGNWQSKAPKTNARPALPSTPSPPSGIRVHTLHYGDPDWLAPCSRSLDRWCQRHGLPLRVRTDWKEDYPSPKHSIREMLREFLKSGEQWFLYIDGDVFIHPVAPLPPLPPRGVMAMPDGQDLMQRWTGWIRKHYGEKPGRHLYRNAGVWACDRESAERLLEVMREPFIEGMQEQHQWNYWLMKSGVPITELPQEFNMFTREPRAGWFFHLAGRGDKLKKLRRVRAAGLLPPEDTEFPVMPPPEIERAIVYPWAPSKAKWEELKYSLRSVEKYFSDRNCPIFILASSPPDWIREGGRVRFIKAPSYTEALVTGLQVAKKVLWMNDDIYLRQPCGWESFEAGTHYGRNVVEWGLSQQPCKTSWRNKLKNLVRALYHHGMDEVFNFSTHTPYVYEYARAVPVLGKFGTYYKIAFETAYFNYHRDIPRRRISAALREIAKNHQGEISLEARGELMRDLPEPAAWEFDRAGVA